MQEHPSEAHTERHSRAGEVPHTDKRHIPRGARGPNCLQLRKEGVVHDRPAVEKGGREVLAEPKRRDLHCRQQDRPPREEGQSLPRRGQAVCHREQR